MKPLPRILTIKPYQPGKPVDDVKRELGLKSVIKLASNESPYGPSPKVCAAIAKAARTVNRYPDSSCYYLRKALARHVGCRQDQLFFGNGSDEVIVSAIRAFVGEGDEVVMARPSFLIYDISTRVVGGRVKAVPLKDFRYDLDGMARAVGPRTKIVFITNPDNPAGTYIPEPDLVSFLERISPETVVFLDEAYHEFVRENDYPDTVRLLEERPQLIVSRTFSKMYGLAGLRIGYGIARPEMIDVLTRVCEPFNVNAVAQAAALACLKDQPYYRRIIREMESQRQLLFEELTAIGLDYVRTSTNFILIRVPGQASDFCRGLLHNGVIVRDMNAWGIENYIRVTIGTPAENKRFLKTLKLVLKKINTQ
ncbi:MAG TPA: histidinol-phosphate transaminase [Candidatus Omnitrophota bacterium]|nr:histidinol-phosphate transaminase [Candidatus Omnitrophota bacterium]HPN55552.1 histidinol-phosphate transaminase [Candidatus Omnitrophota bacterium]